MTDQTEINFNGNYPKGVDPSFIDSIEHGANCPTCGQFAKIYAKRKITSSMALGFILIYRHAQTLENPWSYIKIDDVFNGNPTVRSVTQVTGEFPKLRFWELIKKNDELRDDGSDRTNLYKITPFGAQFVRAYVTVPKYMKIYNNSPLEFWGPQVDIRDCLGNRFNYRELMGY